MKTQTVTQIINIISVKCICSCHKEIEQLKSEILPIKTLFKKELEDLKAVFSSSNDEESNSIKSVNDRLVQHILLENKTKNDIIKILAGNFSVNVNKPQNTNFSLQRPQTDLANSETSMFSEESHFQSLSLNNQNKSLNS